MAKTTTELELKISGGRIVSADVLNNGICKLTIETTVAEVASKNFEDVIMLVEASKLSLDDTFMMYRPKTDEEKAFKKLLSEAIKSGLKDFYRPIIDPSFNEDKAEICYKFGRRPAVGKSYNWWKKTARKFKPNSRLGTRYEYAAFLGVLIKKLVENGWSAAKAWNAVCTDSKDLGHYRNSENAKGTFEDTGAREVCGFFDLANTYKILAEDEEAGGFWLAGGCYGDFSYGDPLADLFRSDIRFFGRSSSVGWLVLDVCSTDH